MMGMTTGQAVSAASTVSVTPNNLS